MTKTYATKSNARRAARAAGIPNDQILITAVSGGFTFEAVPDTVALATADEDIGLVSLAEAAQAATEMASEMEAVVTVRHPHSDELLATVEPGTAEPDIPGFLKREEPTPEEEQATARKIKPAPDPDPGATEATEREQKRRHSRSKNPKAAKKANGKKRGEAPSGKVVEIIRLASRKNGVTPQELNEYTGWKGAPWKWLFSNPKKTGYADRWGYKFTVSKDGGETRYKLEAK